MYYTGKTIMIDHGNALSSIMIHMSKIAVQEGQFVDQGAYLGDIGQTGRATGPHLHWGVFLGNVAVDPALVLQTLAAQPNQTASGAVSE
jgi:murein DD-endopeptidase MepM/ murein hydrolase activator NlpD